jgi:glycosyltransferase involved in cell wall biosynthesis
VSVNVLIPADVRFPLPRANGVQIVKTAAALARAGARTTLLVRASDPRSTEDVLALYGVTPDPLLEVRRLPVSHRTGSYALPRLAFLAQTTAAAVAGRRAVVFTRDLQLADILLGLSSFAHGPVVYESHAVESLLYSERGEIYGTGERANPRKARRLGKRERRVWRGAAAIITTTGGIRDSLREAYGSRQRVHVVPNGADVPAGREFRPPDPALRRVVYAGQLYPWKGVDVLVEAMALIPDARLVILGGFEGEADLGRIRELVRSRGLEARTEMPGTVPQAHVAEELARASVVCVPFLKSAMTERHTSPIKLFEALAAGKPIVASDLPSTREVLTDGVDAVLVAPGDPVLLAGAITRLLRDAGEANRLARAAWEAAPRYSWDNRARALLAAIEEVL